MLTSRFDQREYITHQTPNGLDIFIVRDQSVRKSAVSMSIGAGHFYDPDDCHGLAHLLEHMLFLGNTVFPQPNGINDFMSQHGGHMNAWTGTEFSNYHFDVASESLSEALTQFMAMLSSPRLDPEYLEKEVEAIDAEFKLKQKDDLRRLYQVHKETCNPAHPFSKFSVGNRETLGVFDTTELGDKLNVLHKSLYVARNMKLCVVTNLEPQPLLEQIDSLAQSLPEGELANEALPSLYLSNQLGVQINIKPVKSAKRLIVTFALAPAEKAYRKKPLALISHLLGDEGQGSLLAFLKKQQWAVSLSAGGGIKGRNFRDFNVSMQLTELGLDKIEDILNALFAYLRLMAKGITEEWRHEEKLSLSALAFDFGEPSKPLDEASHYANQMFHFPNDYLVASDILITDIDIECVKHQLEQMHARNMRLKLINDNLQTDKAANWYGTPYSVAALPEALLIKLASPTPVDELALPPPNPYIVSNAKAQNVSDKFATPVSIADTSSFKFWFAQDLQFRLPKGDCFISLDCQATSEGLETASYKRLWVALMMEQFGEQYYHAGVAGLHYHLYPHQAGLSLHTNGFSQNQIKLAQDLFTQLHEKPNFSRHFHHIKHKHTTALQNSLLNKPINRLFTRLSVLLQRYSYAPSEMLPVVANAELSDVLAARERLLEQYHLEAFVHGDWQYQQSEQFSQNLLHLSENHLSDCKIARDVVRLGDDKCLSHDVQSPHEDAAIVVYFQSPSASMKDTAMTIVTEQLIAGPFFNHLRTEKQLGYLVGSGYMPFNQHPGNAFYIQSPHADVNQLYAEIHALLTAYLSDISPMEVIWEKVQKGVIKQLQENDTNLTLKSQRLWMAIGNGDLSLTQQDKLAETVATLCFDDVKAFCRNMVQRNGFGELVLYCQGKHQKALELNCLALTDITEFKRNATYS